MSKKNEDASSLKVCGLVMPISPIDGCDENHWKEVRSILSSSIETSGYEAQLVSDDTDVGVIHKRIVQNLYSNPIIVCDVSAKNPNVMFELGMRLAFDKPVIIVKDDKTPYSFDTAPVEHLTYPRDLRFQSIVDFKEELTAKIESVAKKGNSDSFLKSFGTFKVAEIREEAVAPFELVFDEISSIKSSLRRLEFSKSLRNRDYHIIGQNAPGIGSADMRVVGPDAIEVDVQGTSTYRSRLKGALKAISGVVMVRSERTSESGEELQIMIDRDADTNVIVSEIRLLLSRHS